jgi:hypothetical protein
VLKKSGDPRSAEAHLAACIDTMKRIGDSCNLPQRLKDQASLEVSSGSLTEANSLYDEITDIMEGMIITSNTDYVKASMISSLSDVYLSNFALAQVRHEDSYFNFFGPW